MIIRRIASMVRYLGFRILMSDDRLPLVRQPALRIGGRCHLIFGICALKSK